MAEEDPRYRKRRRKRKQEESLESLATELEEYISQSSETAHSNPKKVSKETAMRLCQRDESGSRIYKSRKPSRKRSKAVAFEEPSTSGNDVGQGEDDCATDENCTSTSEDVQAELEQLVKECEDVLSENTQIRKSHQSWSKRSDIFNENWEKSRKTLTEAKLRNESEPFKKECCICKNHKASVRCHQCGINRVTCYLCDQQIHKSLPLHDRDIFISGFFKPVPPNTCCNSDGELQDCRRTTPFQESKCSTCGSEDIAYHVLENICMLVTSRGRFDLHDVSVECKTCHSFMNNFSVDFALKKGFWPGSIQKPSYFFEEGLFSQWDIIRNNMPGASEMAFVRSLEDFSVTRGRVGTINYKAFHHSFKEWKFCNYELDQLQFKKMMVCPPCFKNQHSAHVDGNMKLYRFKAGGRRQRESYYPEVFIASNQKVENHIKALGTGHKEQKIDSESSRCGDTTWKAAGNKGRKKVHLDETGLQLSGCRHGLAQSAVNMFRGEIYGYAHYIQTHDMIPKGVQHFWYDIVCKYWPWLKKHDPSSASAMSPALSVMHAKAHSWTCQVLWGGRWQKDTAGTTGEEVEQINSSFSKLGNTTKHMTPEGRDERITEHALFWNEKKVVNMALSLAGRYARMKTKLEHAKKELSMASSKYSSVDLRTWKTDVTLFAEVQQANGISEKMSLDEEYFCLHSLLQSTQNQLLTWTYQFMPKYVANLNKITDKYAHLENVRQKLLSSRPSDTDINAFLVSGSTKLRSKLVEELQRKMEYLHCSVFQHRFNMSRLADSCKKRTQLRRKITNDKKSVTDLVQIYNVLCREMSGVNEAAVNDIMEGTFAWVDTADSTDAGMHIRLKKRMVDLDLECLRHEEELQLIKAEMVAYLKYYKDVLLKEIEERLHSLTNEYNGSEEGVVEAKEHMQDTNKTYATERSSQTIVSGKLALTCKGKDFALRQLASGIKLFSNVLQDGLSDFDESLLDLPEEDEQQIEDGSEDEDEDRNEDGTDDEIEDEDETQDVETGTPSVPWHIEESRLTYVEHADVKIVKFPSNFCQGKIDGKNGSNACSIITLLLARRISLCRRFPLPDSLTKSWGKLFYESMVEGNSAYDNCARCRDNRYLTANEAAGILRGCMTIRLDEPLPVRLHDSHQQTCLHFQMSVMLQENSINTAMLTAGGKSCLFATSSDSIIFVDTHSHNSDGMAVVLGSKGCNLEAFSRHCWAVMGINPELYGAFVRIYND